jgi:hypothetical protein
MITTRQITILFLFAVYFIYSLRTASLTEMVGGL